MGNAKPTRIESKLKNHTQRKDEIMSIDVLKDIVVPAASIVVGGGGVAVVNWMVRGMGKNAKHGDRLDAVEYRADRTDKAIGTLLTVTDHQTAGIRAVVEVNKASLNGSYERTMERLDSASEATQTFLRETVIGGKKS
jgi:hypothetical protein